MNVHDYKLLQSHYYIFTLNYCHVTTHYVLIITVLLLDYCKGTFITSSLLHTYYYFIMFLLLQYYYLITTKLLQLTVSLLHGPFCDSLLHEYFNYYHYYRFSWLHNYSLLSLLPLFTPLTWRCRIDPDDGLWHASGAGKRVTGSGRIKSVWILGEAMSNHKEIPLQT